MRSAPGVLDRDAFWTIGVILAAGDGWGLLDFSGEKKSSMELGEGQMNVGTSGEPDITTSQRSKAVRSVARWAEAGGAAVLRDPAATRSRTGGLFLRLCGPCLSAASMVGFLCPGEPRTHSWPLAFPLLPQPKPPSVGALWSPTVGMNHYFLCSHSDCLTRLLQRLLRTFCLSWLFPYLLPQILGASYFS